MTDNPSENIERSQNAYADLSESSRQKLTELEQLLQKETGENIALVAYKI